MLGLQSRLVSLLTVFWSEECPYLKLDTIMLNISLIGPNGNSADGWVKLSATLSE
jgi:hypothetical protein